MKIIKVVYNHDTEFIVDIVKKFSNIAILEFFTTDIYKHKKKITALQTAFGTSNFPLVIFEDENLVEVAAIWPESNPDWEKEIHNTLKRITQCS